MDYIKENLVDFFYWIKFLLLRPSQLELVMISYLYKPILARLLLVIKPFNDYYLC